MSVVCERIGLRDAFGYFRLGLVTGLVESAEVIDWADRMLENGYHTDERLVELSLSGRRPPSELIWLLSSFDHELGHELAIGLLLARAGDILERDPGRALEIGLGLRLLHEEMVLPAALRKELAALKSLLEQRRPDEGTLSARIEALVEPYQRWRPGIASGILVTEERP